MAARWIRPEKIGEIKNSMSTTKGEVIDCVLEILKEHGFDIKGVGAIPPHHAIVVSKVLTITDNIHPPPICNPLLINIILMGDKMICNDMYNNHIYLYFYDPNFLDQLEQLATNGKLLQQ